MQRDYLRYQQQAYRAQLRRTRRPSSMGPLILVSFRIIFRAFRIGLAGWLTVLDPVHL